MTEFSTNLIILSNDYNFFTSDKLKSSISWYEYSYRPPPLIESMRAEQTVLADLQHDLQQKEAEKQRVADGVRRKQEAIRHLKSHLTALREESSQRSAELDDLRDEVRRSGGGDGALQLLRADAAAAADERDESQYVELLRRGFLSTEAGLSLIQEYLHEIRACHFDDAAPVTRQLFAVLVHHRKANRRVDELCTFRISDEYTFQSLLGDAVQYWGGSENGASLRDEHDAILDPSKRVVALLERMKVPGRGQYMLRLVRQDAPAMLLRHDDLRSSASESGSDESSDSEDGAEKRGDGAEDEDDNSGDERMWEQVQRLKIKEISQQQALEPPTFFQELAFQSQSQRLLGRPGTDEEESSLRKMHIRAASCGFWFHLLFIATLITSTQLRSSVEYAAQLNQWVERTVAHRTFSVQNGTQGSAYREASFVSMHTPDHFWRWLNGPVLDTYRQTLEGDAVCSGDVCQNQYNWLVGSIKMQQLRTGAASCRRKRNFAAWAQWGCWGGYSETTRADSFALPWNSGYASLAEHSQSAAATGFRYSAEVRGASITETRLEIIDTHGFALELPRTRGQASLILFELEHNGWVDRATRDVVIQANFLNTNLNLIVTLHFTVAFSIHGPLVPSYTTQVYQVRLLLLLLHLHHLLLLRPPFLTIASRSFSSLCSLASSLAALNVQLLPRNLVRMARVL